jgi:hypothetical protein
VASQRKTWADTTGWSVTLGAASPAVFGSEAALVLNGGSVNAVASWSGDDHQWGDVITGNCQFKLSTYSGSNFGFSWRNWIFQHAGGPNLFYLHRVGDADGTGVPQSLVDGRPYRILFLGSATAIKLAILDTVTGNYLRGTGSFASGFAWAFSSSIGTPEPASQGFSFYNVSTPAMSVGSIAMGPVGTPTVSPDPITVAAGGTVAITATGFDGVDTVASASTGSYSAGTYTAPGSSGSDTLTVSSLYEPTQSVAVSVTVTGGPPALTGGSIGSAAGTASTITVLSIAGPTNGTTPYAESWEYNLTSTGFGGSWSTFSGKTSASLFVNSGLTASTTYYIRRKATDAAAAVAYSNVVTVTTQALPIETTPALDYFTQTQVFGHAPAVTSGGTSPYTGQWYRSAVDGDMPTSLGGTAVAISGQTGNSFQDTPGAPPSSQGKVWYYFRVTTDANGSTARSPIDVASPLADRPRVSIAYYGTSLVNLPSFTDPSAPPSVCGRLLSHLNGLRWVDTLNCGIGGSSAADWLPGAAIRNGDPGQGAGKNLYQWLTTVQVPAWLTAIGRPGAAPDWIVVMHETNDHSVSPSAYQASMQATIDALHALYPSARVAVSYAPFNHAANVPGAEGGTEGNAGLAAKHAATDALAAANPGLVYAIGRDLFRDTAAHPDEADLVTLPQPANSIHFGPQGRSAIGTAWAADLARLIDGVRGLFFPSGLNGGL